MDSALKQRLLGAAVLIALAAIFLPMLLSGPPPGDTELSLEMPAAPERPMETRRVSLQPQVTDRTPRGADLPVVRPGEDEGVARVDLDSARAADAFADDVARAPARQPIAPPTAPVQAAVSPEQPLQRPTEQAPQSAPQTMPIAAPTAPTARVDTPEPVPTGDFLLQIGTFSRQANATALVERLRAAGVQAREGAITISGQPQSRVIAGPYPTRSAAEAARLAVREVDSNLNPRVIAQRSTVSSDDPPDANDGRVGSWVVQTGSFSSEENANSQRDRLRAAGFSAFVDSVAGDEGTAWRVRIGPEVDRDKALQQQRRLSSELSVNGFVVTHP